MAQNEGIMQTAPKIYYADDPNRIWFAGGSVNLFIGLIHHRGIRKKDTGQFDQITEIDYATGCCFCMRSKDFKGLGMFDESFPMYGEDVDLSLRFQKIGGKVYYVPDSKIWHKVSFSVGGELSINKWKRKGLGKVKLIIKHLNPLMALLAFPFLILFAIFELTLNLLIPRFR